MGLNRTRAPGCNLCDGRDPNHTTSAPRVSVLQRGARWLWSMELEVGRPGGYQPVVRRLAATLHLVGMARMRRRGLDECGASAASPGGRGEKATWEDGGGRGEGGQRHGRWEATCTSMDMVSLKISAGEVAPISLAPWMACCHGWRSPSWSRSRAGPSGRSNQPHKMKTGGRGSIACDAKADSLRESLGRQPFVSIR